MHCPSCEPGILETIELEQGLQVKHCPQCGGHWLSANPYWQWLQNHDSPPASEGFDDLSITSQDTHRALICPDCGHLLIKFKVGHGMNFVLDRCNHCNGFWLDQNEWQTLKNHNLHDAIHRICTAQWQKQIRAEEAKSKMQEFYAHKFGQADYDELKKIKDWLNQREQGQAMIRYLADDDPYHI